jgi:hypothetical protein
VADRPPVTTPRLITRDKLKSVLKLHELVVAVESLLADVSGVLPDATGDAAAQADLALANAAAAQAAANSAAAAATAAQADANSLKLPSYVVLGASTLLANERVLAVGPGLSIVDSGAGAAVTLDRSSIVSVLGGDVSDATGAFVNATGLALALAANTTYLVDGLLAFQSAAVTTGLALTFTLPAGASIVGGYSHNTTATAIEGSYNNVAGAVGGNTSAAAVAAANLPIIGRWLIAVGATPGSAQLQFRTEVAASAVTLKAALSALIATRLA